MAVPTYTPAPARLSVTGAAYLAAIFACAALPAGAAILFAWVVGR